MFSLPQLDLKDRSEKILQSVASLEKIEQGKVKLYSNLTKQEISDELHERGIKFSIDENKVSLSKKLVKEMHGMQRLPSLINADRSMLSSHLADYEILGCEPLHDIKHHIENLYTELPHHLSKAERKLMEETITGSFAQKEVKRGVDYRRSLIMLNKVLKGKIDKTVFGILSTLCEIQRILYSSEKERSVHNILRLHNLVFLHKCYIDEVVGDVPKTMTARLLWGKYFHALVAHAAMMYRIISGKSALAENQERTFKSFKTITSQTSNQQPEHVLFNNMIRIQFKDELNKGKVKEQHDISNLSLDLECKKIEYFRGTVIKVHG